MKYSSARKGLKKIFIAEIFTIISVLFSGSTLLLVDALTEAISADKLSVTLVAASILSGFVYLITISLSALISFFGYFQASRDEPEFKKAMFCALAMGAFSVIGACFQIPNGTVYTMFSSVSSIVEMFVLIYSMSGIINLSQNCGRSDMSELSSKVLYFIIGAFIFYAVSTLVSRIFELSTQNQMISVIVSLTSLVVNLIQCVVYMRFISRTIKMLQEE